MGEGLGMYEVQCSSCKYPFYITRLDGVAIGKYVCPHCGASYTEQ